MSSFLRSAATPSAALLGLSILASCASVDEDRRTAIEAAWRGHASPAVHENGAPIPWRVGQAVLLRKEDGGARSLLEIRILQRDRSAWWLSVSEFWPERETQALVLVDGYRPEAPAGLKVRTVRVRRPEGDFVDNEDESSRVPEAKTVRLRVEQVLDAVRHRSATGNRRDVSLPVGTFRNTSTRPIFSRRGADLYGGVVWYTNAVPVVGFAKVQIQRPWLVFLSTTTTVEVVAFGDQPQAPEALSATAPPGGEVRGAGRLDRE